MKVTCYICGKTLPDPGAVIIGPPFKNNQDMSVLTVHKYHICLSCWEPLLKSLEALGDERPRGGKK